MQGHSSWSYAPYSPFLFETGDIYICRVVPSETSIHFEWLKNDNADTYCVYYRKRDCGEFEKAGETKETYFDIENLITDTDFEFYVECKNLKSRIRLARTGYVIGTVVNYLHPDDKVYSFSGNSLCSPDLLIHPDGYWLSTMDVYGTGTPKNFTMIFRSDDKGETWHYVSELMPCFWSRMFLHKGDIYMIACSTSYGDLLIGKSTDGGKTFCTPTVIMRASGGRNGVPGFHKNPQNIVVYNGRIYETIEWGNWDQEEYKHAAMVMSCSVDDDLMVAENWHLTPPVKYSSDWEGVAVGKTLETIEGTLCVAPDGDLYNVMRYNIGDGKPSYGLVLSYKVNTEDPDAPLQYSHAIKYPCNLSKFMIKRDEVSGLYYSIGSRIDCEERIGHRNLLSLMVSEDMENWDVKMDIIDRRCDDHDKVGFQYVDFHFEGDDIVFLCRTAMNNAQSFHNTNYQTFHRIKNFRNI